MPLIEQSLAILEKVPGPDHPNTAANLSNLATLYYAQRGYQEAEPLFKRALAIDEKVLEPDHPTTHVVRDNLAAMQAERAKNEAGR